MTDHQSSIADTSGLYREFYDHVSRQQDIDQRQRSFDDVASYHWKDLLFVREAIAGHPDIRRVLGVGCCGTVYPRLFDLERVEYHATDISAISLERMQERYAGAPIRWSVDDATVLATVSRGSQDLILATQVFEHLPHPEAALSAMVDCLRPGGLAAIGTESILAVTSEPSWIKRRVQELSMACSEPLVLRALEPAFYLTRQQHTFVDGGGVRRTVDVPHGRFHPLFFHAAIAHLGLPARVRWSRYSGSTAADSIARRFGAGAYARYLETKSRIPGLRYLGDQLFVVVERLP